MSKGKSCRCYLQLLLFEKQFLQWIKPKLQIHQGQTIRALAGVYASWTQEQYKQSPEKDSSLKKMTEAAGERLDTVKGSLK